MNQLSAGVVRFLRWILGGLGLAIAAPDPGDVHVQGIVVEARERAAGIWRQLSSESARIEADFDRFLNEANHTTRDVRQDIADALTLKATLGKTSSVYWEQYFRYLIEAHRFDPNGVAAYLLRPGDFVVSFETALRPQLRARRRKAAVGEDTARSQARAIEVLSETFAAAAGRAALGCRDDWRKAAARAEAALARVYGDASRKLDLVRQAVEPQAEPEEGVVLLGARPGEPVGVIAANPAVTRRALGAAFSALDQDAKASGTFAGHEARFVGRLRRSILVTLADSLAAARKAYDHVYLDAFLESGKQATDWLKCKEQLLEGQSIAYGEVPFVVREGKLWQEMARGSVRMFVSNTGKVWVERSLPAFGQWAPTRPQRAAAAAPRPATTGG